MKFPKFILAAFAACAVSTAAFSQSAPSPTFNNVTIQGTGTAVTQSQGDNSTKLATTSYVDTGLATKPTLVGGVIPIAQGGTNASTATAARTNLGLGTAATQNTGTSGANIPLLNGANTWGAGQTIGVAAGLSINDTVSTNRLINFQESGQTVWNLRATSTNSDFNISRYSSGVFVDAPVQISRSTGVTTLLNGLSMGTNAPITFAGTGAATTRSNLGAAASGANSDITSLSGLTTALSVAQGGTGGNTQATARTGLGLGTISTQAASAVAITGGSITGITDLAVADGGTGASTASAALSNLGGAPLASPAFTGTPTAPTASASDNSTTIATTAMVQSAFASHPASTMVAITGGTFTPTLAFGGGATGLTYTTRTGTYTRIGSLVFFTVSIQLSAKGTSTGQAVISGLPFTAVGATGIQFTGYSNITTGGSTPYGLLNDGTTSITLALYNTGTQGGIFDTAMTNATSISLSGVYSTNSLL